MLIAIFPEPFGRGIKNYENTQKFISSSTTWSKQHAKYKDPHLCGSLDILFTSLFLHNMPGPEKGNNSIKSYVHKLISSSSP